jgi:hypothetical protein
MRLGKLTIFQSGRYQMTTNEELIAEARDYAGTDEYGGAQLLRDTASALESQQTENTELRAELLRATELIFWLEKNIGSPALQSKITEYRSVVPVSPEKEAGN